MRSFARPPILMPLILTLLVMSGWYLLTPHAGTPKQTSTQPRSIESEHGTRPASASTAPSTLVGQAQTLSVPEQLPASLAGTSVPGGWDRVDGVGDLIPTPALRQLFEYYLSALGEESLEQLVARIEQTLLALQEPARTQALDTLRAYLDYKLAISDLEAGYGGGTELDAERMQQRMQEIQALRRTWLDSATADAFFAHDEAIDGFQIEKLRISRDPSLTDEQRRVALAQAEDALPEPLRQARRETRRFADYEQARQELADDPEALQNWRRQSFGIETAQRLQALEQEQANWHQRWQAYSTQRQSLLSAGLAGPELEQAIADLRDRHFTEVERVRAQALDSIR
ncbi:lipase secretion chaperone [Marinobacter alexandrii]|jgi:lipase chaperone LimK|uniref:lipase secretion chaperone n=2 Tax=Marinobacter alexandrii TaxID=2570351 RepID=UPI002ABD56C9|nr:lipase secretion chaperone [Marinobacter alexandrii]